MNTMNRQIKVFGAALDVVDNPAKIMVKHAFINRLAKNMIDLNTDFLDPYEGFLLLSHVLTKDIFSKIGKFPVESWLTPRPAVEDYQKLDQDNFLKFINSNQIKEYSNRLEAFIKANVLPHTPLMIGSDHSMTGGVLTALASQYGPENISVIIFDAHFDGISSKMALDLADYSKEHNDEVYAISPEVTDTVDDRSELNDTYTCASFLRYLIRENVILPKNLIIFGCQDYPSENQRSITDPRVKNYVDDYLSFEKKGVHFIPKIDIFPLMIKKLSVILGKIENPYVYISLDVDVGFFKEVLASRYMNIIGIEKEVILAAAEEIQKHIAGKGWELIGLDVMEIETHLLNKTFRKTGKNDQTIAMVDDFLEIFFRE